MNDLDDVWNAVYGGTPPSPSLGHCSVLIKVLQGQGGVKDVFMSHSTWSSYNTMLRILKRYDFYLRKVPTSSGQSGRCRQMGRRVKGKGYSSKTSSVFPLARPSVTPKRAFDALKRTVGLNVLRMSLISMDFVNLQSADVHVWQCFDSTRSSCVKVS